MFLVNQLTKWPTRKVMAAIISGAIIGGFTTFLNLAWPDHPFTPYMEDVDVWLQFAVMAGFAYFTKAKEGDVLNVEFVHPTITK